MGRDDLSLQSLPHIVDEKTVVALQHQQEVRLARLKPFLVGRVYGGRSVASTFLAFSFLDPVAISESLHGAQVFRRRDRHGETCWGTRLNLAFWRKIWNASICRPS